MPHPQPSARLTVLAALMSAVALTACDFGADDDPPAPSAAAAPSPAPAAPSPAPAPVAAVQITGLAATGAAIGNAALTGVCATGTLSGTTASDGTYTLTLDGGQALPCLLRVTPVAGAALHSLAAAGGRVNITPLTELMLAHAAGGNPADRYANFNATVGAALAAGLSAAQTYVNAQLAAVGLAAPSIDPVTGSFAVGDANDLILDNLAARLQSASSSLASLVGAAATGAAFSGVISSGSPSPSPSPSPAPSPAPAPAGALTTYLDFSAAAPATRSVAPSGAMAWAAGTYYGRTSTGMCSLTIGADGTATGTMNGSTQSGAIDGESGDTWVQLASNSMSFGVNFVQPGQGVILTGYAGRLALMQIGGVLDLCAIGFKSGTPLTMGLAAAAPLPIKSSGLQASELPGWLVGTRQGHVAGSMLYPQTASAACSLQVGADGTAVLTANGRSYTAQVSGGAGSASSGDRDSSSTSRQSAYAALTGARDWVWSLTAQTPSGSNTVQVDIELAHTAERSQVSYATGQVKPSVGGLASQFDACYFVN